MIGAVAFIGVRAGLFLHAAIVCTANPIAPSNLAQALTPSSAYTSGAYGGDGYGGGALVQSADSMMLAWSPSAPASGCTLAGYRIYRGGSMVGTTTGTTYTDTGLNANTTYSYYVIAYDSDGHVSAASNIFTGTTLGSGSIPGDVDGDGRVNAIDLSALLTHDSQNYPAADFNHDGTVGAADLAILLGHWTW